MIVNKDQNILIKGLKLKPKTHIVIEDKDKAEDVITTLLGELYNKKEDNSK